MIPVLLATAHAQSTRVFPTDEALVTWIAITATGTRRRLPLVGPADAQRLELGKAPVELLIHTPDADVEAVALEARVRAGTPCAIAIAPLDEGWVGWTSGHCGLLFLGGWHLEGDRVLDDRNRPVTVQQFAAEAGDLEVLRHWRRLDRTRARGIWNGMLGTGLLYAGGLGLAGAGPTDDRTAWYVVLGVGGAFTAAGIGQLAWIQADVRSHPRRIDAWYSPEEIEARVVAHNHRMRLTWTVAPTEAGLAAGLGGSW